VVRKDPDALKNWSPESNQQIAETQRELIDSAFHALRPGGTLVYSTCTLNREENEEVVQWLLARYPQAVEVLPLGALFPQATEALTAEDFSTSFRRFLTAKVFCCPPQENRGDRSATGAGLQSRKISFYAA
jgi:16S rRNA (cytosine1407-C5)-methyltransferase